ncbi:N-6 DNA methylase [Ferroacidibacillus organovorans]|uniref:N-6 DNA methylase n=2 Tax=Ferroacidibacillus organovorans TaxID=1765683 RepID=A0A101XRV3_9BACL|nr:N-6 DNA methylase [Ferroacidibacillus organovorans]
MATAPLGLESIVARELTRLGYEPTLVENGRIMFAGDDDAIARCNMWLRTADRVLLVAGMFRATTFDELFEGTKALPWEHWLPKDAAFPVNGRSVKSQLSSVPACQSIVKKAIVERLSSAYHQSWFDETGHTCRIEIALHKDEALLTIDTSGDGLHKRGYRTLTGPAPLKETLAAALVDLSRYEPHRPFADPMSGTGTIAIEAALKSLCMAPGRLRTFAAESFSFVDHAAFVRAREEARDRQIRQPLDILASDIDPGARKIAEVHAQKAGVLFAIRFETMDIRAFSPDVEYGCVVTNPPYGERMGSDKEVDALYQAMGQAARRTPTWSWFVIAADPQFPRKFGRKSDKNRKLYNGRIECHFHQYLGPLPKRTFANQNTVERENN